MSSPTMDDNDRLRAGTLPADPFDDSEDMPDPEPQPEPEPPKRERSSWWPINLNTISDDDADEEPAILARADGARLLYAGKVSSIAGEPGGMKSWFALVAVLDVLRAGGRALYLDFEDRPKGIKRRLRALGCSVEDFDRFGYSRPLEQVTTESAQADIEEMLAGDVPDLVILDGVTAAYELHDLEPNDAKETARFYRLLPQRWAAVGPAVLMVDHVVKLKEQRGAWATGSGAKKALIDGTLYTAEVEAPFGRGRNGRARILVAKDRPGTVQGYAVDGVHVGTLALMSLPDGSVLWNIETPSAADTVKRGIADPEDELEALMELVSRFVEEHPGCSTRQIEQALKGNAKNKIGAARDTLEGHHIRRDTARSGRTAGWHSVKPYRVDDGSRPETSTDDA